MQSSIEIKKIPLNKFARHWFLNPDISYLNHGSFGACPIPVLEIQHYFRQQIETNPMGFFVRDLEQLWEKALDVLANFFGSDRNNLTFIPNATTGVNTILRSLQFASEDEILITNHEYNACRNVVEFVASNTGAKVIVAYIPLTMTTPTKIIETVLDKVSSKTKLALLDHVTSQTGLVFPIQQLVKELNSKGVDTLVDGAHAPGMLPLNLRDINAAYYTGNCHKWMCAPKGAAFLYVRSDRQELIRPLSISHGANSPRKDKSRFHLEFNWTGTDDPTPYLCIPEAIRFMGSLLPGGWLELMNKNRNLAIAARKLICQTLDIPLPTSDEMLGSLASIPLPNKFLKVSNSSEKIDYLNSLQELLSQKFAIEVPVITWGDSSTQLLRISAQIYNTKEQYEYLAETLKSLIDRTRS
jgi:isopenicillin-N epimerase